MSYQKRYEKSYKGKFRTYKYRAKRKGLEFTLTLKDFQTLVTQQCRYCSYKASGFDRIDNARGYTPDNVKPCCGECNRIRSNVYTYEETQVMITALLKFRSSQK